MKNLLCISRLFLPAVAILLAGCASVQPARFYTLTPLEQQAAKPNPRDEAPPPSVLIAPVEIPDYLDRPQIVTRDGKNELNLAEFDRWAGSLRENIAAVMAENLSILLSSDRVFVYPQVRGEKTDYLMALRILRLDCIPGDSVLLKAQWTIFAGQDRGGVTHMAAFTERLADGSYEALAAAVSSTLAQASREIARTLWTPQQQPPAELMNSKGLQR